MSLTTEKTFETAIVQSLVNQGGYQQGEAHHYSAELGLFKTDIFSFLQKTQPKRWAKLEAIHGTDIQSRILQRLYKEMDLRGALDVIRNGFTDYGVRFQMAFFHPASSLNPDTLALYQQNILKVTRQVYFSTQYQKSIDLVLSLNGIPVATLELKNQFTGQTAQEAKVQYNTARNAKELLFNFKKRALVHFTVDQDEVFMATRLEGEDTFWLPFNQGHQHGKGNPPNPERGYRTAYLWEHILAKDSWLEIIQRFIHLQIEEKTTPQGKTIKKEKMIFPRYHQLDVVRHLTQQVLAEGVGQNYLIQHSAGSGKSNSIAWLAYRLSSLHNAANERIFDSVVVVTDRKVLDNQLQKTIYQFEHKAGVVQRIDKDSSQLLSALGYGTNIIITTLQKFPHIVDKVGDLPDRNYAVIIDEAHSSQGGEASKDLKAVLGDPASDQVDAEEEDDFTGYDFIQEKILASAKARGKQTNLSFFAFTATPKSKTLEIFGRKDAEGKPRAAHLYPMRQAIEEGFILNVLENYTTYQVYFELSKAIDEDPRFNKKKATQAIGRYLALHPTNVAQKTQIIVEHFRKVVAKKINHQAKAMLITGSRKQAKRYYEEFKRYITQQGYDTDIKVLVAFSGKVVDDNYPEGVSEPQLTGYSEKALPGAFETEEYKILIVADKYQTGFDQPLLHTMYVDKKLAGVKAVQTLSRLNRVHPGKEDTLVLDFANDWETIRAAFQPYYETTTLRENTDVNHLYDVKLKLDEYQLYLEAEITGFTNIYFASDKKISHQLQQKLYGWTDPAIDRYRDLANQRNTAEEGKEAQEEFKKMLRTWLNLYSFLSQFMPFIDSELEKFYAFGKYLQTRLPKRDLAESLQVDDKIAMESYRIQKVQEGAIELVEGEDGQLASIDEAGLKRNKEEEATLSEIIELLNDRFGTDFNEGDRRFFEQIESELMDDDTLKTQAQANEMDNFKYAFEDVFLTKLIGRMEDNREIFERILEEKEFGDLVRKVLMRSIYLKMNEL